MRDPRYPIGVLSTQTGVNIETIRYYERIGLMPKPPRTDGQHRVYDPSHLKRLTFIRRGRELGFSLDEIRSLLGLVRSHGLTCAEVKAMTETHITHIRRKVKDLKKLERVLNDLAARCHRRQVPDCPILEALGGNSSACAAAPVSDPSTQRSAPIRVLLSTHDADDGKPHKYKR